MTADQGTALALLRQIVDQDEQALHAFHVQFVNLVYAMALRCLGHGPDAEEVCQDVFMTLWRRASTYDASKGSVVTWLLTMTRRKAIDHYRSHKGETEHASPLDEFENIMPPLADGHANPPRDLDLQRAMTQLPQEQRVCLEMIYFNGFTQEETSTRLQIPLGTVKSRVRLAMGKLREAL